jgi:hypothetical protein
MNKVMAKPATGSPHLAPAATAIRPARAPREAMESSQECLASANKVADWMRRPTVSSGDELVADHADDRRSHRKPEMGSVTMLDELVIADDGREHRARPNDKGNAETRQVLGPLEAVRMRRTCRSFGDSESEPHHRRGRYVREIGRASPSSPTDALKRAKVSSIRPVRPRPMAESPTARLAPRRSAESSRRTGGNGSHCWVSRRCAYELSPVHPSRHHHASHQ